MELRSFIVMGSSQIFIAYATAQTIPTVAVFFFQLNESLTVTCCFHLQTTLLPHRDDMILLSFQLFQEIKSTVTPLLLLSMSSHGKEHGDGCIDG